MSRPQATQPETAVWHYQVWCGMCLAVVFVAQLTQGIFLSNGLVLLLGLLSLVARLRWGSVFLLVTVAFAQSLHYFYAERFLRGGVGSGRTLELHDYLLAMGVLGFLAGHHRLLSIWYHAWPPDPRERRGRPQAAFLWFRSRPPIFPHRRREKHLRSSEFVTLVFLLPMLTLAAIGLISLARMARGWLGAPLGLAPFLVLFWVLLLATWLARQFFEFWNVATFTPITARLFLQDQLWQQVRGEQRRIARWRVWQRNEERAKGR